MKNKRVVIIGGTSGIGLATARIASDAGATVIVASSRQANVDKALAELPKGSLGFAVDSASSAELKDFFNKVGKFDHFVYTAGESLSLMKLEDYDIDAARTFFELRFFAALEAAHLAVPHINKDGSIVFTSGSAAYRPGPGWMLGAAVCKAMIAVTEALAQELAPIRVNAVAPGVIKSPLWGNMSQSEQQTMYDHLATTLPLGRVGEVEDVAKAYLYAMEQEYATGTTTIIDGGTILV